MAHGIEINRRTIKNASSRIKVPLGMLVIGSGMTAWVAGIGSAFMAVATANYFLLLTGFLIRHGNRRAHAALMSVALLSDLALVAILAVQRNAVNEAASFKLSLLRQLHVLFSTSATILYPMMMVLGYQLLKETRNSRTARSRHRRFGVATLIFRTLGFLLMFSMLK